MSNKEIIAKLIAEYGSIEEAIFEDNLDGICHSCGFIQYGVEPDASNYKCDNCGKDEVFGIEETIIMLG